MFGEPDPIFGPTAAAFYWSSTRNTTHPTFSWGVIFDTGLVENAKGEAPVKLVRRHTGRS